MVKKILDFLVMSTAFKKYSAFFGGFALGMWVWVVYWKEIIETLKVWGIDRSLFAQSLLFVVGASGLVASVGLSAVKAKRESKHKVKPAVSPVA